MHPETNASITLLVRVMSRTSPYEGTPARRLWWLPWSSAPRGWVPAADGGMAGGTGGIGDSGLRRAHARMPPPPRSHLRATLAMGFTVLGVLVGRDGILQVCGAVRDGGIGVGCVGDLEQRFP